MQSVSPKREEVGQLALASSEMEDNDTDSAHGQEQTKETCLTLILKELREFRKDSMKEIREEINKTNMRIEEAEKRIDTAETWIPAAEEAVTELLKLLKYIWMQSSQTWKAAPEERTSKYMELKREQRRNLYRWYVMLSACYGVNTLTGMKDPPFFSSFFHS